MSDLATVGMCRSVQRCSVPLSSITPDTDFVKKAETAMQAKQE